MKKVYFLKKDHSLFGRKGRVIGPNFYQSLEPEHKALFIKNTSDENSIGIKYKSRPIKSSSTDMLEAGFITRTADSLNDSIYKRMAEIRESSISYYDTNLTGNTNKGDYISGVDSISGEDDLPNSFEELGF